MPHLMGGIMHLSDDRWGMPPWAVGPSDHHNQRVAHGVQRAADSCPCVHILLRVIVKIMRRRRGAGGGVKIILGAADYGYAANTIATRIDVFWSETTPISPGSAQLVHDRHAQGQGGLGAAGLRTPESGRDALGRGRQQQQCDERV